MHRKLNFVQFTYRAVQLLYSLLVPKIVPTFDIECLEYGAPFHSYEFISLHANKFVYPKEKRSSHIKENIFRCKEIIDVGITFDIPVIR